MTSVTAGDVIAQAIAASAFEDGPRRELLAARRVIAALKNAGWHLISTPVVERVNVPDIPDEHLAAADRFGGPRLERRVSVRARIDDTLIDSSSSVDRAILVQAVDREGLQRMIEGRVGEDFLQRLGLYLGVPTYPPRT